MNRDQDHLRLLGIFYYVHAALISCTTSFGVVYLGFFAAMMPMMASEMEAEAERQRIAAQQTEEALEQQESSESSDEEQETDSSSNAPPSGQPANQPLPAPVGTGPPEAFFPLISSMLYGMGAIMLLFGFLMAFANVFAARCIARRKHRTFCLLTAGFNCLNTPLGLILGICSFLVLLRPTVEDLFTRHSPDSEVVLDADIID
jgi:hypothetical protein